MESEMTGQLSQERVFEERYNPRPLIYVAVAITAIGFLFFACHRIYSLAKPIDGSLWGEFGDFTGGVVGTIIAYISIRLLVATLNTQTESNTIAKDTMRRNIEASTLQQLNTNFEMMINIYREALERFQDNAGQNGAAWLKSQMDAIYAAYNSQSLSYQERNKEAVQKFERFYIDHRAEASVYFRIVYRILELIFYADILSEDKAYFSKMFRCQISEEELFFIRYNAMTPNGRNIRKYLNQYNILKHLPEISILEFKRHIDGKFIDAQKSQLISYMIGLRKTLIRRDKWSPDYELMPIGNTYTLHSEMNETRSTFKFRIERPVVVQGQQVNGLPGVFNEFSANELSDYFCDFITELFTTYTFCEYQKPEEIEVVPSANIEEGKDIIEIVVRSLIQDRPLYLYKENVPNP